MAEIYKTDALNMTLWLPGTGQHMVSAEVLFKQVAAAFKGGKLVYGGRTDIRVDGDGRVFVNERCIFTPRGLEEAS